MRTIRRAKKPVHVDSEGSWAISYGDMITLLLAFFVLYFTVDHNKTKNNKMREMLTLHLSAALQKPNIGRDNLVEIGSSPGKGIQAEVQQRLGAEIFKVGKMLIIDFPDVSFFQSGAIVTTEKGTAELQKFAQAYLPFAAYNQLNINAFTDIKKVRADQYRFQDNLELSALRAVAATRVLQKAGIPLSNMRVGGLGELAATQEMLDKLQNSKDPLRFTRKVVLTIEPLREGI